LWRYSQEFFVASEAEAAMIKAGVGVDLEIVKEHWFQKVREILYMAHLSIPENQFQLNGGKQGKHSENLGFILTEMQYLPSKYPDAKW
jgi:ring-1,2-phenylacetyl-CoA epoxidase subunit PaaC